MKYFSIITFNLLGLISCLAQAELSGIQDLEINGEPFNQSVNTIYEDESGFLWIGCKSGLYRYDGYEIKHFQFNVFDDYSIPNNNINSIIEDKFQNLWLGSESYIIHFNRKENKFYGFYKSNSSTIIGKDSFGNIYAAISGKGFTKITPQEKVDHSTFTTLFDYNNDSNTMAKIQNMDLVEDGFERIWFASWFGIGVLNQKGEFSNTEFKQPVKSLIHLRNNKLLALCDDSIYVLGYNKSSIQLEVLEHYASSLFRKASLKSIAMDTLKNELWVGGSNGLYKGTRSDNRFIFRKSFPNSQEITPLDKKVTSTIFDSYGNLWIGTFKGVKKYVRGKSIFESHKFYPSNTNNVMSNSLLSFGKNTLLIGRLGGLFKYNLRKQKFSQIDVDLSKVSLISQNFEKNKLLLSSDNTLYETSLFKSSMPSLDVSELAKFNGQITSIIPINKNEIWVGIWGRGIQIINRENPLSDFKEKVVSLFNDQHVSTMLLTPKMELWVGTRGQGLYKIDMNNEKIEGFQPQKSNGISSNAILSLYQDDNDNIWIGTRGGGLNKYDAETKTFSTYGVRDGLNSNIISAIEGDDSGNLWLFTQEGIIRLDVDHEKFTSFGAENENIEIVSGFNVSTASENRKELFFGCADGFNMVKTDKYLQNNKTPTTVITSFQTLGASKNNSDPYNGMSYSSDVNIFSNDEIKLPFDRNSIAIKFSALDLTSPKNNKYAYTLEGLNDGWIYTDASNRNANYNDLSPGGYIFKVKSSNGDGIWNEDPIEVKFTILPPLWASQWAILIYSIIACLVIITCFFLIRKWYTMKKNLVMETISREKDKEHHQMKMTFFTDISHELRTPLTLILGTMEKVLKTKEHTLSTDSSQRIYSNTLRMHRLINQIMDLQKHDDGKLKLNISKNNIITDIKIIKNAFDDFAKNNNINYELHTNLDHLYAWYDVDILEKVLFNLLSNAFKYTPEQGKITISVALVDRDRNPVEKENSNKGAFIKCSVQDNGIGIPEKDLPHIFDRFYQSIKTYKNQIPGTGIGMRLVQKLVERHHGSIDVKSVEKEFTKFTFHLPINKDAFKKSELIKRATPLKKNFIKNSEYQVIGIQKTDTEKDNTNHQKNKPTILLVEDNTDLRQMLREDLQNEFNVIEASNGVEGYKSANAETPELIVSDILMPLGDGISMLQKIKQNEHLKDIPIFMLTAKNAAEDKIKCLALGADDYIEKPFSLEFVKWKIKNTLSRTFDLKEKYSRVITARPTDNEIVSNDEKFISKLVGIIEEYMADNQLNVEFLASEVGMSRANLYRKVQAILNDTPVNFIKKIRLERAAQLLKKDSIYISEIAYMTGFNNQKYFGKCFSKEYNMSPTEYIKKYASNEEENLDETRKVS
ncbi:ATP-binding protein [Flagellimonas sp. MMG031]|uniref:histidine kinase n=1 Tax=Flagellimonas sp. MMG031 TaxID=3158549 RepID=A0AAU7MZD6_9FLAO